MKLRIWLAALLISAAALGTRYSAPVVQAAREAGQDAPASTLDDQVDLAVTVYNSWSRTTSTICSNRTSCCASTSGAT